MMMAMVVRGLVVQRKGKGEMRMEMKEGFRGSFGCSIRKDER